MRNEFRIMAAVIIAASAACDGGDEVELYGGEEAATPALEGAATQPAEDAALMTGPFEAPADAPEGNQASGTISVFPAGGTGPDPATGSSTEETAFRIEASLEGLSQGEHAWHIHSGPCGEDAPVVVAFSPTEEMEGLTQPLSANAEGRAEGTATVPIEQLSLDRLQTERYSVHVHAQGGVDHGPTVACADLDGGLEN